MILAFVGYHTFNKNITNKGNYNDKYNQEI